MQQILATFDACFPESRLGPQHSTSIATALPWTPFGVVAALWAGDQFKAALDYQQQVSSAFASSARTCSRPACDL
jgi:hypothetical protein